MTPLLLAALGTALTLLGLWGLIDRAWWLMLRLSDPALERSRAALQRERILQLHAARERDRQQQLAQRSRRQRRVIDLDGQRRWLDPEALRAFHCRCWQELELAVDTPWPQVRQQWRRRCLAWHPDQGGDPSDWLRRQRAYDALRDALASPPWRRSSPVGAAPVSRLAAAPVRRWFHWPR